MGYPYDKTYLEQIQEHENECEEIEQVFIILQKKFIKDHKEYTCVEDLSLAENFEILGEAFDLASYTLDGVSDVYHFMWDVLEVLLTPKEKNGKDIYG